jgi:hypothetical protein
MKVIISLLSLLIFFLLVLTYVKISKFNKLSYEYNLKKHISLTKSKSEEDLNFSSINYKSLPARILYEKIDFRNIKTVVLYKVVIKNDDKFAIFNILKILKEKDIPYSMIKQKKTQIFVVFRNLKEAEDVLNLFKFYNFPVKLQKIIKRI